MLLGRTGSITMIEGSHFLIFFLALTLVATEKLVGAHPALFAAN